MTVNNRAEMSRIVVVGASLAGLRAAEALRAEGFAGEIVVVGDEPVEPYDRPPLSKEVLTGAMAADGLQLRRDADLAVTWRLGRTAAALDPGRRVVHLAGGEVLAYDGLVIATGSRARGLTTFDVAENVHTIRTIDDAVRLKSVLRPGVSLLVVGCGFIGVEVASSARSLGVDVTMIGIDPPLAPAGPLVSARATELLEAHGVRLHPGQGVASTETSELGHRVTLTDGSVVEADQVVVAVGSMPNLEWLAGSGLPLDDGLVCDETLRVVGFPDIVAAGDIVRWPHPLFRASMRVEHWSNAVEQGKAAAKTLLRGDDAEPFVGIPSFWSDHFGIRLQSVGALRLATRYDVFQEDAETGKFAAFAFDEDDRLVGGVTYGLPRSMAECRVKLARAAAEIARAL